METDNIIAAPQVVGNIFYEEWRKTHYGSRAAFLRFITTPSVEREEFIESMREKVAYTFTGNIAEITLNKNL